MLIEDFFLVIILIAGALFLAPPIMRIITRPKNDRLQQALDRENEAIALIEARRHEINASLLERQATEELERALAVQMGVDAPQQGPAGPKGKSNESV